MSVITKILATLVGLEFLYIMYLESVMTTSATTSKLFGMSQEELKRPSVNALFKNQGIYNGLIGCLVFIAVMVFASKAAVMVLMGYIILVAIYGSVTVDTSIWWKQGGLAILTLLSGLF
ncbi:DUF1304 domain-containing protein [Lactobacillus selangorensis]|nr:DUF1304 family protein [Lactobacillus selangorensis]